MLTIHAAERGWLPDWLLRAGIRQRVGARAQMLERGGANSGAFRQSLEHSPIALEAGAANAQHYEVPTALFELMLGPRMKYSACLFATASESLERAEDAMLAATCARARLADGQRILELGCGWGSLCLYMAERYPRSRIVAVSNSATQRAYILDRAARQGLANVEVIVADMNTFAIDDRFDRVVSVEMFEHMRNWPHLFERVHGWLEDDGLLFLHVFCHRHAAYPFALADSRDWLARHFFAEGMMPSRDLVADCARSFEVRDTHEINGKHYSATLERWLEQLDASTDTALRVLATSGSEVVPAVQLQRWRMFLLASSELFSFNDGEDWFVLHALLARREAGASASRGARHG